MVFLDNVLNWFFIIKIGIDILFKYIIVWFVKDKELCKYYYKKVGFIYDELLRDGIGCI